MQDGEDDPAHQIDRVADVFEAALRRNEQPSIQEFVDNAAPAARERLLPELVQIEYGWRLKRGEDVHISDYVRKFPALTDASFLLRQDETNPLLKSSSAPIAQVTRPSVSKAIDDSIPQKIGRYPITARLDHGGQAVVFRGVHPTLHADVAIKLWQGPIGAGAVGSERLVVEGQVLAGLQHPNIARVYDMDRDEQGRPFLVMRFIRGRTLRQYASGTSITPARAAEIVAAVASALSAAHHVGALHLDVKPDNIMIDENGQPQVIDFGLARLRGAWQEDPSNDLVISGTVQFMPPEQARGDMASLGPRSDLFSLGGVLYFLLTGHAPYEGGTTRQLLARAEKCEIDFSLLSGKGIPRALGAVCRKAMQAVQSDRYADAAAMGADLQRFIHRLQRRLIAAALCLCLLIVILVLSRGVTGHWPFQAMWDPAPIVLSQPLEVTVLRGVGDDEHWVPLADAVPLVNGDQLRVRTTVPAGCYGSLFIIDGDGSPPEPLIRIDPSTVDQTLSYPPDNLRPPLDGAAGTSVLVVCIRRTTAVTADEVRAAWPGGNRWPSLPEKTIIPEPAGERSRGMGPDPDSPVAEVTRLLQMFQQGLHDHCPATTAVAFPHQVNP